MYPTYRTPGVYLEPVVPEKAFALETGISVFLGLVRKKDAEEADKGLTLTESRIPGVFRIEPLRRDVFGYRSGAGDYFPMFTTWPSAVEALGGLIWAGYLGQGLRGFFENGGQACYVHPVCYDETLCLAHEAVTQALVELEDLAAGDLICMPDLMWLLDVDDTVTADDVIEIQNRILGHCAKVKGRFAVLDGLPGADTTTVCAQRKKLKGDSGALYHPWLKTMGDGTAKRQNLVPPGGHVCGIYARSDRARGIHKAPANEEILGVFDVETLIGDREQGVLNPVGVNVIRPFAGRGIRVWGARTLSHRTEWAYVNVRRFYLTLARWLEGILARLVFEPNGPGLWNRIVRELSGHLDQAFRQGALMGRRPEEAFYVICDDSTNTPESRDRGFVVTEIGIAPAAPMEFIVIRIVHSDGGAMISEGREAEPVLQEDSAVVPVLPAVVVAHVEYTVDGPDVEGEYVLIENREPRDVDLGNWILRDSFGHAYTFPGLTLPSGGTCRIWTKGGIDSSRDLFWGMNRAVWNNTGDQAELRDREGRVVSVYRYAGVRRGERRNP